MKLFPLFVLMFGSVNAAKLASKFNPSAFEHPHAKTAFCISGNVRKNHGLEQSNGLKKVMDSIDPSGLKFAFVNPCLQETRPWAMEQKKAWPGPPPCHSDPWANSSWKAILQPTVLKEYRDKDVFPPPHEKDCPKGGGWLVGVYQQFKGVHECFQLIEEYEKQHKFQFETVVRIRADACADEGRCAQSVYCPVDQLDKSKAYMHHHDHMPSATIPGAHGHFFDNFAIVPRKYADVYFNAIDVYKDCTAGGAGEAMVNRQLHKFHVPVDDKCECSPDAWRPFFCPPPGKVVLFRRKSLDDDEVELVLVDENRKDELSRQAGFVAIRD